MGEELSLACIALFSDPIEYTIFFNIGVHVWKVYHFHQISVG